ncbi:MAG: PAS domain S-box protein, partial [Proteobacteria bacterium]|nr:PAS domain S-box protein [Pseudomonadota bacterium]
MTAPDKYPVRNRLVSRRSLCLGLVVLAMAAAYAILFPWLIKTFGPRTRIFSLSFVLLAAWQWGLWGGVAASIVNLGLYLILHQSLGQPLAGGPLGVIVSMSLAVVVGRLSDVTRRLKEQLATKRRTEEKLSEYHAHLETEVQARTAALTEANRRLEAEISERRRVEDALREGEEKYRLVVENASEAILVAQDGKIRFFNARTAAMTGYSPDELIDRPFDQFLHFEDRAMVVERHQRRVAGEKLPPAYDFRVLTAAGETRWLEVNAVRFDWEGRPATLNFLTDVTDRKNAEAALKASEQMFQAAFRFSPDWVSISTLDDGRYLDVNEAYCQGTGWGRGEVIGKTSTEIGLWVDPEDRRRGAELIEKNGRLNQMEAAFCRKNGQQIIALWSAAPVTIGDQACIISVVQDITDQKKAEQSLRASEKRFRDLFESITDLVYTQDLEGRFLSVNPALAETFGHPPEELIGRRAAEFMKPEFREAFETEYLHALRTEGRYAGTSLYFRANGQRRYIDYRSSLVRPDEGEPYISGTGRDVTEQIKAEKQLKSLQHQLLQAQKMEAVGTLASGIAHDFNNILHAVSGYLELLGSRRRDIPPDHRHLAEINLLTERAAELVRRLLTFSRKVESRTELVDLNGEVVQTVKMLERTIPKMIEINTDLAEDLWPVRGDRTQIEQVVMNLV